MDFWNPSNDIWDFIDIKNKIIIWYIINTHTYIDYLMTLKINKYFLKIWNIDISKKIKKDIKTKIFNHNIIELLSFVKKIDIVDEMLRSHIDNKILSENIEKLKKMNTLRNSLAHVYDFDLSSKKEKSDTWRLEYKREDIFSVNWIKLYNKDYANLDTFLS